MARVDCYGIHVFIQENKHLKVLTIYRQINSHITRLHNIKLVRNLETLLIRKQNMIITLEKILM